MDDALRQIVLVGAYNLCGSVGRNMYTTQKGVTRWITPFCLFLVIVGG